MNQKNLLAVMTGLAVLIAAAGLVGQSVVERAESMQPATTGAAAFDAAKPGSDVKLIVRVDALGPNNTMTARLLTKQTESIYAATSTNLGAHWNAQTKFIMGAAADLKAGSVIEIVGTLAADRSVDATKLVVLSEYVHVAP